MGKIILALFLGMTLILSPAGFTATDDTTAPPTPREGSQVTTPEEDWWDEWEEGDEGEESAEKGLAAEAKPQATKPAPKAPPKKDLPPPAAVKK
jgi:hypothetical protein